MPGANSPTRCLRMGDARIAPRIAGRMNCNTFMMMKENANRRGGTSRRVPRAMVIIGITGAIDIAHIRRKVPTDSKPTMSWSRCLDL